MAETLRYGLILAACTALSLGGIVVAALLCRPVDGVRGGAIAVGLALVTMFLGRDYGGLPLSAVLSRLSWLRRKFDRATAAPSLPDLTARLGRMEEQLLEISQAVRASQAISSTDVRRQNIFLALSSGIGTMAWGFGDWPAQWLADWLARCPAG